MQMIELINTYTSFCAKTLTNQHIFILMYFEIFTESTLLKAPYRAELAH